MQHYQCLMSITGIGLLPITTRKWFNIVRQITVHKRLRTRSTCEERDRAVT